MGFPLVIGKASLQSCTTNIVDLILSNTIYLICFNLWFSLCFMLLIVHCATRLTFGFACDFTALQKSLVLLFQNLNRFTDHPHLSPSQPHLICHQDHCGAPKQLLITDNEVLCQLFLLFQIES